MKAKELSGFNEQVRGSALAGPRPFICSRPRLERTLMAKTEINDEHRLIATLHLNNIKQDHYIHNLSINKQPYIPS